MELTSLNVKPAVGFTLPWAGVTPAPDNKKGCGTSSLLELFSLCDSPARRRSKLRRRVRKRVRRRSCPGRAARPPRLSPRSRTRFGCVQAGSITRASRATRQESETHTSGTAREPRGTGKSRAPFEDERICCAAGDIVSQSRSASASPVKYDRTLAAAPPIISRSDVLRSFSPQTDTKARAAAREQDRRGGEDFRGDPEGQQRDREVIDDRMQMIRADQLSKHESRLLIYWFVVTYSTTVTFIFMLPWPVPQ